MLGRAPATVVANVSATLERTPALDRHGRRSTRPACPGSINVVLAKSDSAALGVHGIAVQRLDGSGNEPWSATRLRAHQRHRDAARGHGAARRVRSDRRSTAGSRAGAPRRARQADRRPAGVDGRLAGRRRAQPPPVGARPRDGPPVLTFDGEQATIPEPLSADARLAVSFLLEEDRARAFSLRQPIVDLRDRARHPRRRRRASGRRRTSRLPRRPGPRRRARSTTARVSDDDRRRARTRPGPGSPTRHRTRSTEPVAPARATRRYTSARDRRAGLPDRRPAAAPSRCSIDARGLAAPRRPPRTRGGRPGRVGTTTGPRGLRPRRASPAPTATGATPRSTCSTPTGSAATSWRSWRTARVRHRSRAATLACETWRSPGSCPPTPLRLDVRLAALGDGVEVAALHLGGAAQSLRAPPSR